jgi:glyoxylase-like metal-dependent hydrolase (beta-lactamase superfamily II)
VQLGDIRIDPVLDGTTTVPAGELLVRPGFEADPWADHQDMLTGEGLMELPVGSFLVRTGERTVLVDAGLGRIESGPHRGGRLLDNLGSLGIRPEDVTDVVLSHLHFDHVGWTTQKGRVVFPHAAYRCHEDDWAHFVTGPHADPGAVRKLTPLESRLETFTDAATLAPGVDARSAPGHTPGSTIVVLSSGSERAMLLGDAVHCPFELTESDWQAVFDVDPGLARRTREVLARELEGSDVLLGAPHFPGLEFGRLLAGEGRQAWVLV